MQKLIDKFNNSRFFTISLLLHVIIVAIFGGTVLFHAIQEPPDFEGEGGGFVSQGDAPVAPQAPTAPPTETTFTVTTPAAPSTSLQTITTTSTSPLDFTMNSVIAPPVTTPTTVDSAVAAPVAPPTSAGAMDATQRQAIGEFTGGWGKGRGTGSGTGIRQREFEFTAFLGKYAGGNWSSAVTVQGGKIVGGSLPNLLYVISKWSREKIKTNERNVKAIALDSDELFSIKPPFIFLTGSRDFKLTEKEVTNLRKYVQVGGAIWGDSSVPGRNSRFDIAFRREMRRVIPDVDKDFEPLPESHPIFTKSYYPEVRGVPPGLNYYKEPVYALKIYDEIAILYTANDYGDMWQIGLSEDGKIDLGRDERGNYVAINPNIWAQRDVYIHNLNEKALQDSFKFGINVVVHLLTRWENKVSSAPRL